MNELPNDTVMRALRQMPEVAPDEAFVVAVSARIQSRRRLLQGLYALLGLAAVAALVLLAPALLNLAGVLATAPARVLPLLPRLQSALLVLPLAAAVPVLGWLWYGQRS